MSDPDQFAETFHAPGPRVAWFSEVICANVGAADPIRVLDIGCGAGDQVLDLAARLPRARLVGLDVVPTNVEAARRRVPSGSAAARCTFEAIDYRIFQPDRPFDLVISYSVLQAVPGGVEQLAARIADDTAPGGLFINVMPYRCVYNAGLYAVRRVLRAARSGATDRLLMGVARLVHGSSMNEELLAERIAYAYAIPVQLADDLTAALERREFVVVARSPVAHASVAQPKHVLLVMRRGGSEG